MRYHLGLSQAAGCVQVNDKSEPPVLEALLKEWGLEVDLGVMEAVDYTAQLIHVQDGRVSGAQRTVCVSMSYQEGKGVTAKESEIFWR